MLDPQCITLDVSERSPSSIPARKAFADADLNSAYALLATRFPEEAFSRDFVVGGGTRKVQAGLVAALITVSALLVVRNFS